jgi:hypothetical protein
VPEAQTSLIFTGPPGSEIGTPGFDQPDAGDRFRLFNVAARIPKARRFSRKHHGQGELLDQVFASAAFFSLGLDNRRRLPTADSHIHFEGPLPSVGDNPRARVMAVGPDHAPVTATFRL